MFAKTLVSPAFAGMHGPPPRRVLLFLGYILQARRLIPHGSDHRRHALKQRKRDSRAKSECPEISVLGHTAGIILFGKWAPTIKISRAMIFRI